MDITCYDAQGYHLDFLTQWDLNRVAVLSGIDLSPAPRVRFRNKRSTTSIVVRPTVSDKCARVDIPNSLLTQALPIIIEVFYEYEDNSVAARYFFSIPVVPCQKPEDYNVEDNIDYVNWSELQSKAKALIEEVESTRDVDIIVINDIEPDESELIWFDTTEVSG